MVCDTLKKKLYNTRCRILTQHIFEPILWKRHIRTYLNDKCFEV
jgi:hypothetical protein